MGVEGYSIILTDEEYQELKVALAKPPKPPTEQMLSMIRRYNEMIKSGKLIIDKDAL